MQGHERQHGHRFIMRVPLRFHAMKETVFPEESVSSMNISTHGVYFATDQRVTEGLMVQLHLKMPKEIVGYDVEEWSFTGRVTHVEPLNRQNGKSGVGVQFLFYEVPRPAMN
jgi:PilZ domain-containing protein